MRSALKMLQQAINNQKVGKKDEWEKLAECLYLLKLVARGVGFIILFCFCMCLKISLIESF